MFVFAHFSSLIRTVVVTTILLGGAPGSPPGNQSLALKRKNVMSAIKNGAKISVVLKLYL